MGLVLATWPVSRAQAQFSFGVGGFGGSSDHRRQTTEFPQGGSGSSSAGRSSDAPQSDSGRGSTDYPQSRPGGLDILRLFPPRFNQPERRSTQPQPEVSPSPSIPALSPRDAFEQKLLAATPEQAVQEIEAFQMASFSQYLQLPNTATPPTATQISLQLALIAQETGKRPAVLYGVALKGQTHLVLVLPTTHLFSQIPQPQRIASQHLSPALLAQMPTTPVIREVLPEVPRATVVDLAKQFRQGVSNPTELDQPRYLPAAQQLYRWMVSPLEPQLRAHKIDTLLFSLDDGLRTIPIAALHDGNQFLVERYSSALIPSFGLTQITRPPSQKPQSMLAMGITKSTEGLAPLPAVSTEIATITEKIWTGPSQKTLDEATTLANLKQLYQQGRFGVLHLATHAAFNPGQVNQSYIQFWNERLTLPQVRQLSEDLQWRQLPALQLLVLSACQTALGNKEAELGFAGTAVNAGVPTAIASLWSVADQGTLGVMTGFYDTLKTTTTKADALRQAQLRLLRGTGLPLATTATPSPEEPGVLWGGEPSFNPQPQFAHPYFWSGYTVVGNWN
jgi:CHAT domain-containing protein